MGLSHHSSFPLHKPFELQNSTTPLSEIAYRLVVNFYSDNPYIIGTATILCSHLLVSAKHVLDFNWADHAGNVNPRDEHLVALQQLPDGQYIVWDIVAAIADPISDLVLLHLGSNPCKSHSDKPYQWKQFNVNPFSPKIGESIAAFGYRKSILNVSKNSNGGNHIDLNDEPIICSSSDLI